MRNGPGHASDLLLLLQVLVLVLVFAPLLCRQPGLPLRCLSLQHLLGGTA
jgi:hypothetical protein